MRKTVITILLIFGITLLGGGLFVIRYIDDDINSSQHEIDVSHTSVAKIDDFFATRISEPFVNSAVSATVSRQDSIYDKDYSSFSAPEGFTIRSYSKVWDEGMLELLYLELLRNTHGEEMKILYEIVIYPEETDDFVLASFTPTSTSDDIEFAFPALPDDFKLTITRNVGRIVLHGGDTKTTIESMAVSLSHEYGHLYTFYHMPEIFDTEEGVAARSSYAVFREAGRYDLIMGEYDDALYRAQRHRFLFEVAAEDYILFMGSPTTRQVAEYVDVRQLLNGAENPPISIAARNAFPQENMMLPLGNDVPGLKEYFYSFIDTEAVPPIEDKMTISLNIETVPVGHDLVGGFRTFTHYNLTWNTPYSEAVYTIACYEIENYTGWARPIKTVSGGGSASAVVGTVTSVRGEQVFIQNDDIAQGKKVFYVAALLPDGTYYLSDKLAIEF
ncbi:MAG: hypothetical protein LBD23_02035 [Oscillospiraceae bacterium]|jgi:hypothetical protein|nr:hypothetical protein [Oscillospiraceae bacterium]